MHLFKWFKVSKIDEGNRVQIFIFLKLERNLTINNVMTLKSTVSGPLLDQISVPLSDGARNTDNEKRAFVP